MTVFTASLVVCARMLWAQHGQQQQGMADKAAVDESKVLLAKVETIFHNLDQDNNMVQSCLDYIRRLGRMCSIKGK